MHQVLPKRKKGRIHLERLPAYSSELNPVGLVWCPRKRSLKNQQARLSGFHQQEEPTTAVLEQVKQLEENRNWYKHSSIINE